MTIFKTQRLQRNIVVSKEALEGTGELIEKWEVDEMMNDGDKNQDGMLDYEGETPLL